MRRSCQTMARPSGRPVVALPDQRRLALVGDADGGDVAGRDARPARSRRGRWRRRSTRCRRDRARPSPTAGSAAGTPPARWPRCPCPRRRRWPGSRSCPGRWRGCGVIGVPLPAHDRRAWLQGGRSRPGPLSRRAHPPGQAAPAAASGGWLPDDEHRGLGALHHPRRLAAEEELLEAVATVRGRARSDRRTGPSPYRGWPWPARCSRRGAFRSDSRGGRGLLRAREGRLGELPAGVVVAFDGPPVLEQPHRRSEIVRGERLADGDAR